MKSTSATLEGVASPATIDVSFELVLPARVLQLLLTVLAEMSQGNAVSVVPRHQELSTQEAASILNVSRPFLVGLLEKGEIPHRKVGSHRRDRFADVLAYKERMDEPRLATLDELTALSQQQGMGY